MDIHLSYNRPLHVCRSSSNRIIFKRLAMIISYKNLLIHYTLQLSASTEDDMCSSFEELASTEVLRSDKCNV